MALRLNRLALNSAMPVTGASAVAGAVGGLAASGGSVIVALVVGGVVGLVAGVTTYRSVYGRVARRMSLARQVLREARKRQFEGLARLPQGSDERDELDALIRQVYRAGRTLQREIERMEKVESYRREFLGDVSHELRTPIFAVSGFAETLLDGAMDDERVRERFVSKILSNARRLESLSRDLAQISKLETGQLALDPQVFSLGPLAQETVDSLEGIAAEGDVHLAIRLAPSLPTVRADRERVRQVLTNLAENAIKYNDPGGQVEIVARALPGQDRVRVGVVDDGIGIPPEALPRLTERFYRVDKSRSRRRGGTGLGLAIVKHILEAHGTQLRVDSRPDYGSTFSFELKAEPISRPDALTSGATIPASAPEAVSTVVASGG